VTVFDDSSGWLADVVAQVGSVSVPLLVLALALQSGQTLLNAGAWGNVLRAAYPAAPPAYRQVLGAYGGGIALNVVLPAQGGTVAMLAFFRRRIAGATVLGLLGAAPVQSLFFIVVGGAVWAGLLASRPETFHLKYAWLYNHPALALAAAVVAAVVARAAWGRFRTRLAAVTEGGAVLRTPRRFVCGVLGLQFAAYVLRMSVFATFMRAYGIPVSLGSVLLLMGVSAVSSTFSATPGGVGTQSGPCHRRPQGYGLEPDRGRVLARPADARRVGPWSSASCCSGRRSAPRRRGTWPGDGTAPTVPSRCTWSPHDGEAAAVGRGAELGRREHVRTRDDQPARLRTGRTRTCPLPLHSRTGRITADVVRRIAGRRQQRTGIEHRGRDSDELPASAAGLVAEHPEGCFLVDPVPFHQDPLGAFDHRAASERALQCVVLGEATQDDLDGALELLITRRVREIREHTTSRSFADEGRILGTNQHDHRAGSLPHDLRDQLLCVGVVVVDRHDRDVGRLVLAPRSDRADVGLPRDDDMTETCQQGGDLIEVLLALIGHEHPQLTSRFRCHSSTASPAASIPPPW
jgi:uncharacterized membrane protein YbhN (UPF0104 family)